MDGRRIRNLGAVTDLRTAGSVLDIGRTKSFELVRRGEFPVPVLRLGSTYRVPVAPLMRLLGLGQGVAGPASPEIPPMSDLSTVAKLDRHGG